MIYPLTSSTWGQEELDAINRVIASGRFTMGEEVAAFEREFADYHGMRYAVMVNSGSSANLVAVAALTHKQSDHPILQNHEVIVPAVSWATTYYPFAQYGLWLRFVDIDLHTLNLDVEQLERAMTPLTKIVVAVNILGNPAPLDRIRHFCDERGLILFEDNCESMGARLNGKYCGTFGHINTFSTFYSHHISTMEGGMILTDDRELADLCLVIRNHGWARDLADDSPILGKRHTDQFSEAYRVLMPVYNVRPLEFSGAIGRAQLPKLRGFVAERRKNAELFHELFGNDDRFIIQRENGESSWFAFTFILQPNVDRDAIFGKLREAGIEFRMITGGCFPRHEAVKYMKHRTVGNLPNANAVHDRGFFVGNHPRDLTAELLHLKKVLA